MVSADPQTALVSRRHRLEILIYVQREICLDSVVRPVVGRGVVWDQMGERMLQLVQPVSPIRVSVAVVTEVEQDHRLPLLRMS